MNKNNNECVLVLSNKNEADNDLVFYTLIVITALLPILLLILGLLYNSLFKNKTDLIQETIADKFAAIFCQVFFDKTLRNVPGISPISKKQVILTTENNGELSAIQITLTRTIALLDQPTGIIATLTAINNNSIPGVTFSMDDGNLTIEFTKECPFFEYIIGKPSTEFVDQMLSLFIGYLKTKKQDLFREMKNHVAFKKLFKVYEEIKPHIDKALNPNTPLNNAHLLFSDEKEGSANLVVFKPQINKTLPIMNERLPKPPLTLSCLHKALSKMLGKDHMVPLEDNPLKLEFRLDPDQKEPVKKLWRCLDVERVSEQAYQQTLLALFNERNQERSVVQFDKKDLENFFNRLSFSFSSKIEQQGLGYVVTIFPAGARDANPLFLDKDEIHLLFDFIAEYFEGITVSHDNDKSLVTVKQNLKTKESFFKIGLIDFEKDAKPLIHLEQLMTFCALSAPLYRKKMKDLFKKIQNDCKNLAELLKFSQKTTSLLNFANEAGELVWAELEVDPSSMSYEDLSLAYNDFQKNLTRVHTGNDAMPGFRIEQKNGKLWIIIHSTQPENHLTNKLNTFALTLKNHIKKKTRELMENNKPSREESERMSLLSTCRQELSNIQKQLVDNMTWLEKIIAEAKKILKDENDKVDLFFKNYKSLNSLTADLTIAVKNLHETRNQFENEYNKFSKYIHNLQKLLENCQGKYSENLKISLDSMSAEALKEQQEILLKQRGEPEKQKDPEELYQKNEKSYKDAASAVKHAYKSCEKAAKQKEGQYTSTVASRTPQTQRRGAKQKNSPDGKGKEKAETQANNNDSSDSESSNENEERKTVTVEFFPAHAGGVPTDAAKEIENNPSLGELQEFGDLVVMLCVNAQGSLGDYYQTNGALQAAAAYAAIHAARLVRSHEHNQVRHYLAERLLEPTFANQGITPFLPFLQAITHQGKSLTVKNIEDFSFAHDPFFGSLMNKEKYNSNIDFQLHTQNKDSQFYQKWLARLKQACEQLHAFYHMTCQLPNETDLPIKIAAVHFALLSVRDAWHLLRTYSESYKINMDEECPLDQVTKEWLHQATLAANQTVHPEDDRHNNFQIHCVKFSKKVKKLMAKGVPDELLGAPMLAEGAASAARGLFPQGAGGGSAASTTATVNPTSK